MDASGGGGEKRHEMARLGLQKAKTLDPRLKMPGMTEGVGDAIDT